MGDDAGDIAGLNPHTLSSLLFPLLGNYHLSSICHLNCGKPQHIYRHSLPLPPRLRWGPMSLSQSTQRHPALGTLLLHHPSSEAAREEPHPEQGPACAQPGEPRCPTVLEADLQELLQPWSQSVSKKPALERRQCLPGKEASRSREAERETHHTKVQVRGRTALLWLRGMGTGTPACGCPATASEESHPGEKVVMCWFGGA